MDKTVVNRSRRRFTEGEYRAIRDYIGRKTGLNLQLDKDSDLRDLLAERLTTAFPDRSFQQYFEALRLEGESGPELRFLVSRLTVGETHFFRNKPQVRALRNAILPDLIRKKGAGSRTLNIWSAGCSTGEEPYTLAMILRELIPDVSTWSISILATDINTEALEAARAGVYREWSFRDVEEYYMRRYFIHRENGWEISRELVDMVSFRYLNLAEDLYPAAVTHTDALDLIVCRNVMIYFTVALSLQVTERFYRCLREGGYLVVGHSEHSEMVCPKFSRKLFDPAIYYQKGSAGGQWERAITLRFRGSGELPENAFPHERKGSEKKRTPRPQNTEETTLFEEAAVLYRRRRLDEARDIFARVVGMNGDNLRARYMLALIAADSGDFVRAEKEAREILGREPLHLMAMYLLSLVYRIRGESAKEIEYLKKTVYINRFFVMGHFQMGVFYLNAGNERLACRSLRNVLDILRDAEPSHVIEGVEGLTVQGLRQSVFAMYPGEIAEEYLDD